MTIKRYLTDPTLAGCMEVVELLPGERQVVRFGETWFHPQGGGQKADRGTIGPTSVIDVRHGENGTVDHYVGSLAGLQIGQAYPFTVDEEWRVLNSRFHTGAHLLVGVVGRMFPGLIVVGGHQWPGEARVDFSGTRLESVVDRRDELEAAVQAEIARDLRVILLGDQHTYRACQIGSYPPIPCSGTHAQSTVELGQFKLRSIKQKRDRLRMGYEVLAA